MFISMHTSGQDWLSGIPPNRSLAVRPQILESCRTYKCSPVMLTAFARVLLVFFYVRKCQTDVNKFFVLGFFFFKREILMAGDLKIQLQRGLPVRRSANFQAGLPLWIHPVALGPHPAVELQSSQSSLHQPLLWLKKKLDSPPPVTEALLGIFAFFDLNLFKYFYPKMITFNFYPPSEQIQ